MHTDGVDLSGAIPTPVPANLSGAWSIIGNGKVQEEKGWEHKKLFVASLYVDVTLAVDYSVTWLVFKVTVMLTWYLMGCSSSEIYKNRGFTAQKRLQKANLWSPPRDTSLTVTVVTAEESGIEGSVSDLKTIWKKAEVPVSKDKISHMYSTPEIQAKLLSSTRMIFTLWRWKVISTFSQQEPSTPWCKRFLLTRTKCGTIQRHDNLFCPQTLTVAEKGATLCVLSWG